MKRMRFFAVISILLFSIAHGVFTVEKARAGTLEDCMAAAGTSEILRNKCRTDQAMSDCLAAAGTSEVRRNTCTNQLTPVGGTYYNGLSCDSVIDQTQRDECFTQAEEEANQKNTANAGWVAPSVASGQVVPDSCSFGTSFSLSGCANSFFIWFIKTFLIETSAFLVWVSANMMNYSIQIGILNFAKWAPSSLYPIWIIIRQIVSLFIVFAGLWLGFMYIIDKGKEFEKYIPWVIIFALFVNFSYPLVRTVIDVSNIVSLNIYASAVGNDALTATATSPNTAGALIMNRIGLQGLLFSATKVDSSGSDMGKLTSPSSIPGALLVVAFILYAAYIFFIITFLLVTRTAVLVFLIIVSPLLFVDKVIPQLGKKAEELRGIFLEMLFVGPVFAIMLALTLKFLEVFGNIKESGSAVTGDGVIVEFFNILMMLIMLHIMYKVTKATAGALGTASLGVMGNVGKYTLGGVAGLGARAGFAGAAWAGRKGIGATAAKLQGNKWMAGDNALARTAFRMTGAVANANFDGRNLGVVQKTAGRLGMSGGMGTGGKLGYDAVLDAKSKDRSMRANFVNNYAKKKENRMREEFNAIDEKNTPERKKWLSNMRQNGSQDQKSFAGKLEDEEMRKAMVVYKNIDQSTASGLREASEFKDKHKGDDELSKKISESIGEHDKKIDNIKTEKAEQQNYQKETLQTNKEMVAELKAQSNARLGGGDPTKNASVEALQSVASHQAENKYIVQTPTEPLPAGYTTNPGGVIAIPINMNPSVSPGGTTITTTDVSPTGSGIVAQNSPAPFDVRNVDLNKLQTNKKGGVATTPSATSQEQANLAEEFELI